jgi:hypothetical protein
VTSPASTAPTLRPRRDDVSELEIAATFSMTSSLSEGVNCAFNETSEPPPVSRHASRYFPSMPIFSSNFISLHKLAQRKEHPSRGLV